MSLIEKIDEEIVKHKSLVVTCKEESNSMYHLGVGDGLNKAKEILSEQKDTCTLQATCYTDKPIKTKGDAIRESNESLASVIEALVAIALGDTSFIDVKRRLEWLNQPQEDTNE